MGWSTCPPPSSSSASAPSLSSILTGYINVNSFLKKGIHFEIALDVRAIVSTEEAKRQQEHLYFTHTHTHTHTRPVESKSLNVGKSLKIGKNRIKSDKIGKIGIHFLLDFFRLFGNLLKRSLIRTWDLKRDLAKVGSFLFIICCSQNACTSI